MRLCASQRFKSLVKGGYFFQIENLSLNSLVDFNALLKHFCELIDFLYCLSVPFFLLFHNFQWSVLLTEDSVESLTVDPFDFHEVVSSSCTLYMK